MCGEQLPPRTSKLHRERGVCGGKCNGNLIRRMKREVERGDRPGYAPPKSFLDWTEQERSRAPRRFATRESAEFPYEHGRFPIEGDVVERHGQHTAYVTIDEVPWRSLYVAQFIEPEAIAPLAAVHVESGLWAVFFRGEHGEPKNFTLGHVYLSDTHEVQLTFGAAKPILDIPEFGPLYADVETVDDVDEAGSEYRWQAFVFSPAPVAHLWTPSRTALSAQRRRITTARNAYQARMRALGVLDANADAVDPLDVYERDEWVCQLCNRPVDRTLRWPDPWCVTLDHRMPVSGFGEHTATNLQTAHWYCNVAKGNRA